jgi:hypothetical protein
MRGGLRSLVARHDDRPLLELKVPLHINSPPGVSSVDAELVFYLDVHVANGQVRADVVGGAHPWRFHGDGVGAGQDEIERGLRNAVESSLPQLGPLSALFARYRGRDAYLVPGSAAGKLEDGQPLQGRVMGRMTLAIVR